MPVIRLGAKTPEANTLTSLGVSTISGVASVIITNTSTVTASVTLYVKPFDSGSNPSEWSYVTSGLSLSGGVTFETFRFYVGVNDEIFAQANTNAVNYTVTAVYDSEGRSNVSYSPVEPTTPAVGDIWVSSSTSDVKLWTGSSWNSIALNAPAGPQGNTGATGPTGPQGNQGVNFTLKGTVATVNDLPAADNLPTDAYYVSATGNVHVWNDFSWVNIGPIIGPTGPQAVNFTLKGSVADFASLPSVDNILEDGYFVTAESVVYVWNGLSWVSVGPILGPTGPTGPTGSAGTPGSTGPTGAQAVSFTLKGSVDDLLSFPTTGLTVNDAYYVTSEAEVHVWSGTVWNGVGPIVGPQGIQGPTGPTGPEGIPGEATGYTPAVSGNWNVAPNTIAEALDELAARLKVLETP